MTGNVRKVIFFVLLLTAAYVAYAFMIKPANKNLAERKERIQQNMKILNELQQATTAARAITTKAMTARRMPLDSIGRRVGVVGSSVSSIECGAVTRPRSCAN